jgi:hypothetical protein
MTACRSLRIAHHFTGQCRRHPAHLPRRESAQKRRKAGGYRNGYYEGSPQRFAASGRDLLCWSGLTELSVNRKPGAGKN